MSDDNSDFACPMTGEPLDICGCEAHGPAVPRTTPGASTLTASRPESSSDAPITPCEVIDPPKEPARAPALSVAPTSSARVLAANGASGTSGAGGTSGGADDPKAAVGSAGAMATTSSEPPATLQLAAADAKPARRHTKAQARDLEVVKRADRKVRLANVRTMMMIHRAPEIDPDAPKPEGWTDKDFRIAKAAWKSTRECPSFITIAEKTYSTLVRAEAMSERDPSPQLNCDIQVFVNQQNIYNYESVEGDDHK